MPEWDRNGKMHTNNNMHSLNWGGGIQGQYFREQNSTYSFVCLGQTSLPIEDNAYNNKRETLNTSVKDLALVFGCKNVLDK